MRTPLPIYVEYTGSDTIKKIVLRYKGLGMGDFKALELKKMGSGYGGEVPCTDVGEVSDFKYFIQVFNDQGDNVAGGGSKNNPYVVKIKKEISGEPLHLPNKPPPKQCKDTSDCPEGPAGAACRGEKSGGGNAEGKDAGEECEGDDECKSGKCYRRRNAPRPRSRRWAPTATTTANARRASARPARATTSRRSRGGEHKRRDSSSGSRSATTSPSSRARTAACATAP